MHGVSTSQMSSDGSSPLLDERPSPPGLQHITGTLMWAAFSALHREPHSISSDLEGLFISLVYISMDGKGWRGGSYLDNSLEAWQSRRLAQFANRSMENQGFVAEHLRGLVASLHGLFWPLGAAGWMRNYRSDVTVQEVQEVCATVVAAQPGKRLQRDSTPPQEAGGH